MKTDNLFKFVAARPPMAKKDITHMGGDDETIQEVNDLITKKVVEVPLEHARLIIGSELVNSDRYFAATAPGMISVTRQVETLLQVIRKDQDYQEFCDEALEILANIDHLTREDIPRLKRSLWLSYYATVLNPNEHPQDREVITSWLLFFYLFEAGTKETFTVRVQRLHRTRLAVPAAFFTHPPAPRTAERPPIESEDALKKRRAKELRARIAELTNAHRALNNLHVAKLRNFEQTQPVEVSAAPVEREEREAGRPVTVSVGVDLLHLAPWRIIDEDLKNYAEPFRLAREVGIVPELATLPELISRLEAEIASLTAEASTLETREELMLVGRTFVKVRRRQTFEQ